MMTPTDNHRTMRKSFELQRLKSLRLRHHATSKQLDVSAADDGDAVDGSSDNQDGCIKDASSNKARRDPTAGVPADAPVVAVAPTTSRRYLALRRFKNRRSSSGSNPNNGNAASFSSNGAGTCSTPGTEDGSCHSPSPSNSNVHRRHATPRNTTNCSPAVNTSPIISTAPNSHGSSSYHATGLLESSPQSIISSSNKESVVRVLFPKEDLGGISNDDANYGTVVHHGGSYVDKTIADSTPTSGGSVQQVIHNKEKGVVGARSFQYRKGPYGRRTAKKPVLPPISLLCKSVVPIQRKSRQYLARKCVIWRVCSLILIQSVYRGYRARMEYKMMQRGAVALQSAQRGRMARDRCRTLMLLVECATAIQCRYRGSRSRCALTVQRRSATVIQTAARRMLDSEFYISVLCAVVTIQSFLRRIVYQTRYARYRTAKREREVRNATCIQKVWRGICAREVLLDQHEAATWIQANVRRYIYKNEYTTALWAAVEIQSAVRKFLVRKSYVRYLAAVRIQSNIRRMIAGTRCVIMICAVMQIQSLMRMGLVQTRIRAERARVKIKAAVVIQSNVRAVTSQRQYNSMLSNIVLVQCLLRKRRACQSVCRKRKEKRVKEENMAAMKIEAAWRCFVARREYVITIGDVILCQSIIRRHLSSQFVRQVRHTKCINDAATLLQTNYRMHSAIEHYIHVISCIILVEAMVRSWLSARFVGQKRELRRMDAAKRVQASWRGFATQSQYEKTLLNIVIAQCVVRKWIALNHFRRLKDEKLLAENNAATMIQSSYRSFVSRREYVITIGDVILCQSIIRRHLSSQFVRQVRHTKCINDAATLLQTNYRMHLAIDQYIHAISCIILIEAMVRRWLSARFVGQKRELRRMDAAKRVQASWRGFATKNQHEKTLLNIVILQCVARKMIAMRHVARLKEVKCQAENNAVTIIQSRGRGFVCARNHRRTISNLVKIQSLARRLVAFAKMEKMRYRRSAMAATTIQATWRSFSASNQYIQTMMDVILVQSLCRKRLALTHFKRLKDEKCLVEKNEATIIQSRSRGLTCAEKYRQTVLDLVRIQSLARKLIAVTQIEQMRFVRSVNACTNMQAAWRAFSARNQYTLTIASVVLLQSLCRRRLALECAEKLKEEKCLAESRAATMIQSEFRAHFARMEYMLIVWDNILAQSLARCAVESCSVTKISSSWRRFLCSMKYRQTIEDIILCQAIVRRNINKSQVNALRHKCATSIQSSWRACFQRIVYKQAISDVVLIQTIARRLICLRISCDLREKKHMAECVSATKISSCWRGCICWRKYRHMILNFICVQSLARRWIAKRNAVRLRERDVAAAVIIQTFLGRKFIASRDADRRREEKQMAENAATRISALWRGYIRYSEYKQFVKAVTICQSAVRCSRAQSQYEQLHLKRLIESATLIQTRLRAHLASIDYIQTISDVVLVQSVARKLFSLKRLDVLRKEKDQLKWRVESDAATTISSVWRGFACSKEYIYTIADVILCQSVYRRKVARKKHQWLCDITHEEACAGHINEIWRAFIRRERFVRVISKTERPLPSANKVDKIWIEFAAQNTCQSICSGVSSYQTVIQSNLETKEVSFYKVRVSNTAAIVIQSKWRSWVASENFIDYIICVIELQCLIRRYLASKCLQQLKSAELMDRVRWNEDESATKIGAFWRCFYCRRQFACSLEAIIVCQSISRCWLASLHLATTCQNDFERAANAKTINSQRENHHKIKSATRIQANWRSHIAMEKFTECMSSIVAIQTVARQWIALTQARIAKEDEERQCGAATKIQASWLAFYERREFVLDILDIITCQSVVRQFLAKRINSRSKYHRKISSATRIQAYWRSHTASKEFLKSMSSIVAIQTVARQWIALTQVRIAKEDEERQCGAATKIQASWLAFYERREFVLDILDIILCQSVVRSFLTRKHLKHQPKECVRPQTPKRDTSLYNANLFGTTIRQKIAIHKYHTSPQRKIHPSCELKDHSTHYTSSDRQFILRKMIATKKIGQIIQSHLRKQQAAATKIQAIYRGYSCETTWYHTLKCVIVCQGIVRRWRAVWLAEELRSYKKEGPKDIFEFIKTRQTATLLLQQTYQEYSSRKSQQAHKNYLVRTDGGNNAPSNTRAILSNANASSLEEAVGQAATLTVKQASCTNRAVSFAEAEDITYIVDKEDEKLDSQCFISSRCGLSDEMHTMLINSGKWFYNCLGDPSNETAEDMVTVMELSEEYAAVICCWKKKNQEKTVHSSSLEPEAPATKEATDQDLPAVVIQSKWRSCMTRRQYKADAHAKTLERLESSEDQHEDEHSNEVRSPVIGPPTISRTHASAFEPEPEPLGVDKKRTDSTPKRMGLQEIAMKKEASEDASVTQCSSDNDSVCNISPNRVLRL